VRADVLGDVGDEAEPAQIRVRIAGEDLLVEVVEDEEEREEDRKLEENREAGGKGIDLVLPVELHDLLVHLLLVVLVLLLDRLQLRRVHLEALHRPELLDRERQDHDPHDQREDDDRPRPREPDRRVQPLEEVGEDVLDRGERIHQRALKSVWSRA
jgi:hypothetical protein